MVGAKSLGLACVAMATVLMVAVWRHQGQSVVNLKTSRRVKRSSLDDLPLSARVTVNLTAPVAIVDERFLSVGCTLGSINRTLGQIFNSTRFHTVARGLAPAIFRIGGAEADFTDFESDDSDVHNVGKLTFFNMTIHGKVWDDLHEFTRSVGWEILFSLNALHRTASGEWDPTNAIELLNYNKKKGHHTLWSLGNEPNGYPRKAHVNITGDKMAKSFHKLRDVMIREIGEEGAFVSGPDISAPRKLKPHPGPRLTATDTYLNEFLNVAGNTTNVTSFHFYYISGRSASYFNFTNPDLADLLIPNIASVRGCVNKYRPHRPQVWITESGVTFASGTTGISQNYAIGFLLLDKLGIAARYGASLVVQQGLEGKSGGILDKTFYPRLQYWMLLYHKRLMGTHVLDVSKVISAKVVDPLRGPSINFTKYVRIYAHCTKTSWMYSPGSVTLMIINMVPIEGVPISVGGALRMSRIDEYLFTPLGTQGVFSPKAKLSGQRLELTDDLTIPYLKPRRFPADTVIHVPSMTYGFYVFPDAAAPACMSAN